MNPAPLSPRARTSALKKLASQHLDVLVIDSAAPPVAN